VYNRARRLTSDESTSGLLVHLHKLLFRAVHLDLGEYSSGRADGTAFRERRLALSAERRDTRPDLERFLA
jgi:hypothetical protein